MTVPTVRIGEPAPDFSAFDIEGRSIRLSALRRRRNVVLLLTNTFGCTYCMAHLAQLRALYPRFRQERAEVVVVSPDPEPDWHIHWKGINLPAVGVPDPGRQVATLYRQERRMAFWLPAAFIIDRRGRLRYARYSATLRDLPLAEHLLAELARINRPGRDPENAAVTSPERRAALAAGAAAFVSWLPEVWRERFQAGWALGATGEEWLTAILAHVTGEIAGQVLAEELLAGPWLSAATLRHAGGSAQAVLHSLAEVAGVQDRLVLLVRLLEIKDPYTAGHGERVGALTSAIGMHLGLPPDDVEDLAVSGLLHDVGKVVVPTHVLHKPGKLNATEIAAMRAHPLASEELISRFTTIGRICPAVRHHHEQWGGGGYPDGIAGSDIPEGARILAVCDAYDAMTSTRPYRDAMPSAQAIAIMNDNEHDQWEPRLVEELHVVLDGNRQTLAAAGPVR